MLNALRKTRGQELDQQSLADGGSQREEGSEEGSSSSSSDSDSSEDTRACEASETGVHGDRNVFSHAGSGVTGWKKNGGQLATGLVQK